MGGHAAFGSLGEDRDPGRDQQVFQQVEPGGSRLAVHSHVARYLGHVEGRRLREAGAFQEPAERGQVAGASFFEHLLAEVVLDVRCQAAQQVDAPPAQAASARSGQDEAQTCRLDQPVDLVEDQRRPLHFVDHDPSVMAARDQVPQPLRPRQQLQVQGMVEQIEVEGIREPLLQQRGLAGPAGAEEEEALASGGGDLQRSGIHIPILRCKTGVSIPK